MGRLQLRTLLRSVFLAIVILPWAEAQDGAVVPLQPRITEAPQPPKARLRFFGRQDAFPNMCQSVQGELPAT